MTCIVGIEYDGGVLIAGDSAGMDSSYNITIRADEKVFSRKGPPQYDTMVFGYTSSFRMGQLLRYDLTIPKLNYGSGYDTDVDRYMATKFMNLVRSCFERGGYLEKNNEKESGGSFLVGISKPINALYKVESDFQIGRSREHFNAVGCGAAYALGALRAIDQLKVLDQYSDLTITIDEAMDYALIALRIAEKSSGGVRGPFLAVTTFSGESFILGE